MAAWRKEAMAKARELLKALPPAERKQKLQAFRDASPKEKLKLLKELGIEPPKGIFKNDPLHVIDGLQFQTGAECVAALERRLLVTPLDEAQRASLLSVIGVSDPAAPLDSAALDVDARRALLRLMTSVPQYQLC
jgi:hypothetical protein